MSDFTDRFTALARRLKSIEFRGVGPPEPPYGEAPSLEQCRDPLNRGRYFLPIAYQDNYVAPLEKRLETVLARQTADLEAFTAPIYQQVDPEVASPLRRFLAVLSDLYWSFLDQAKQKAIGAPEPLQVLPPLAFFKHEAGDAPYTFPVDSVMSSFGASIGVVGLPSTHRADPILWAILAHETGGHDVIHAQPGLLDELRRGVITQFSKTPWKPGAKPTDSQMLGLLWSSWMDEAASDVYGVLNVGPAFALNLAAYFAALTARDLKDQGPFPWLLSESSVQKGILDPHPTDILRLDLAIGAVQNLRGLKAQDRAKYAKMIDEIRDLCVQGASEIVLNGEVEIPAGRRLLFDQPIKMKVMRDSAQKVGAYIVTAKLKALNGRTIQDVETWDNGDETMANLAATTLPSGQVSAIEGDDAQLLAGATLALLKDPSAYQTVTNGLNSALDRSYSNDPTWSARAGHAARPRPGAAKPRTA
jgi:hypothetical protein